MLRQYFFGISFSIAPTFSRAGLKMRRIIGAPQSPRAGRPTARRRGSRPGLRSASRRPSGSTAPASGSTSACWRSGRRRSSPRAGRCDARARTRRRNAVRSISRKRTKACILWMSRRTALARSCKPPDQRIGGVVERVAGSPSAAAASRRAGRSAPDREWQTTSCARSTKARGTGKLARGAAAARPSRTGRRRRLRPARRRPRGHAGFGKVARGVAPALEIVGRGQASRGARRSSGRRVSTSGREQLQLLACFGRDQRRASRRVGQQGRPPVGGR